MSDEYEFLVRSIERDLDVLQRRIDAVTLVVSLLTTISVGFLAAAVGDASDPMPWRIVASITSGIAIAVVVWILFNNRLVFPNLYGLYSEWGLSRTRLEVMQGELLKSLMRCWSTNSSVVAVATVLAVITIVATGVSVAISIFLLLN